MDDFLLSNIVELTELDDAFVVTLKLAYKPPNCSLPREIAFTGCALSRARAWAQAFEHAACWLRENDPKQKDPD